ncbi:MAG: hypothetical protein U5L11_00120 [Arhodomonas sp.]|nr:hypothetical protein [Arhodomonas sp.]
MVVGSTAAAPADQGTPWLRIDGDDEAVAWRLERALERLTAGTGIPGTLVRVDGRGVLLAGDSGAGKSHTALALLERGHTLIADDLVTLEGGSGAVVGRPADPRAGGTLLPRGLGPLRVDRHFGRGAVATASPIALVVALDPQAGTDELHSGWQGTGLLGRPLPRLALRPGPLIATLIEAGLRETRLAAGREPG